MKAGLLRLNVSFTSGLHCNRPRGWRQWLGQALVALAGRIDGRWYMAVEIVAVPALPHHETRQCLTAGLQHARNLIGESVRAACLEDALRQVRPDLYDQEHQ